MFLSSLNIVAKLGPSPHDFSSNLLLIIGLQYVAIIIIIIVIIINQYVCHDSVMYY